MEKRIDHKLKNYHFCYQKKTQFLCENDLRNLKNQIVPERYKRHSPDILKLK